MLDTRTALHHDATSTFADAVIDLDEDDFTELIDDALAEAKSDTAPHALVVSLLSHFLWAWAYPRRAGIIVTDDPSLGRGVCPDIRFFGTEEFPTAACDDCDEARPDLIVEVLATDTVSRDRIAKLHEYVELCVPEYWIVDPRHRTLERLVLWRGQYAIADALSDDDVFRPPTFEGLEIPLEDLWAL